MAEEKRDVARMAAVLREIARSGDARSVARIPRYRADEVGALADVANEMIDRLEQTATQDSLTGAWNRRLWLRYTVPGPRTPHLPERIGRVRWKRLPNIWQYAVIGGCLF